jgi:hypothetical protein
LFLEGIVTNRNWTQLLTVLLISSILLIGAVQRFDTIQAKKIIITGSGGLNLGTTSGSFDLNAKQMILDDDADTTLAASTDDQAVMTLGAATGYFNVDTGNLRVGDATPTFTQTGEDAYIEGTVEMASDLIMGPQSTISVVFGIPITPTGWYQPIQSADFGSGDGQAVTPIAAPANDTNGTRLLLYNINASQVITIDGTGTTVECKADIVLGSTDTLELFWNGDDWKCIANYDNS